MIFHAVRITGGWACGTAVDVPSAETGGLQMTDKVSFRQALTRTALMPLSFGAVLAVGMVVTEGLPDRQAGRPTAYPTASVPQTLIQQHGCWTGEAPADMVGEVPGHVVVTTDERTLLGGRKYVEQALEQVFDGVDHGLRVHAFCR